MADSNVDANSAILKEELKDYILLNRNKPAALASVLARFHQKGLSCKEIADCMKWKAELHRQHHSDISTFPQHIKDLVNNHQIAATNAIALSRVPSEELTPELIARAQSKDVKEFEQFIESRLKYYRMACRVGADPGNCFDPDYFLPEPRIRQQAEIQARYRRKREENEYNSGYMEALRVFIENDYPSQALRNEVDRIHKSSQVKAELNPSPFNKGYADAMNFALQMDESSLAAGKVLTKLGNRHG